MFLFCGVLLPLILPSQTGGFDPITKDLLTFEPAPT